MERAPRPCVGSRACTADQRPSRSAHIWPLERTESDDPDRRHVRRGVRCESDRRSGQRLVADCSSDAVRVAVVVGRVA